ncbi:DUF6053 domain-containing protein [Lysobacter enzymogenes]|uniref:DUF6053 domain-containing protein n=1 Tax=Lysobacter enzymogenes TaxID=69 RepID=UPI003D18C49C
MLRRRVGGVSGPAFSARIAAKAAPLRQRSGFYGKPSGPTPFDRIGAKGVGPEGLPTSALRRS